MEFALTFGSVGDIIAICQVAIQLRHALNSGSAEQYQALRQDLDNFTQILMRVLGTYEQRELTPHLAGLDRATKSAVDECAAAIKQFLDRVLPKYGQSLGLGTSCKGKLEDAYRKIEWSLKEKERVHRLQELLKTNVQRLSLLSSLATQRSNRVDTETLLARIAEVDTHIRKAEADGAKLLQMFHEQSAAQDHQQHQLEQVSSELARANNELKTQTQVVTQTSGSLRIILTGMYEIKNMISRLTQLVVSIQIAVSDSFLLLRTLDPQRGQSVMLEDSMGNIIPIPPEIMKILEWDTLHRLLQRQFQGAKGYTKVCNREYALEEAVSGRDLDRSIPLSASLRRGMKVFMTMLFYKRGVDTAISGSCPRCQHVTKAAEDTTIQCPTDGCGMFFKLQLHRIESESHHSSYSRISDSHGSDTTERGFRKPRVDRRVHLDHLNAKEHSTKPRGLTVRSVPVQPADFQRVRIMITLEVVRLAKGPEVPKVKERSSSGPAEPEATEKPSSASESEATEELSSVPTSSDATEGSSSDFSKKVDIKGKSKATDGSLSGSTKSDANEGSSSAFIRTLDIKGKSKATDESWSVSAMSMPMRDHPLPSSSRWPTRSSPKLPMDCCQPPPSPMALATPIYSMDTQIQPLEEGQGDETTNLLEDDMVDLAYHVVHATKLGQIKLPDGVLPDRSRYERLGSLIGPLSRRLNMNDRPMVSTGRQLGPPDSIAELVEIVVHATACGQISLCSEAADPAKYEKLLSLSETRILDGKVDMMLSADTFRDFQKFRVDMRLSADRLRRVGESRAFSSAGHHAPGSSFLQRLLRRNPLRDGTGSRRSATTSRTLRYISDEDFLGVVSTLEGLARAKEFVANRDSEYPVYDRGFSHISSELDPVDDITKDNLEVNYDQESIFSDVSAATTTQTDPPPTRDKRHLTFAEMSQAMPMGAPPILDSTHPCEFCQAPFAAAQHEQWVHHVTSVHLHHAFPRTVGCVFCPETFSAWTDTQSDRQSNFFRRMEHMQGHIEDSTMDDREAFWRPDWHLYGYLQGQGFLSDSEMERLTADFIPTVNAAGGAE